MTTTREIVAAWRGGHGFEAHNPSGGRVEFGSRAGEAAISSIEIVLAALAGCSGSDVVDILAKKRQELTALEIRVKGERAETYPQVYTAIEVEYDLYGRNLSARAAEQAIELSEKRYCAVAAMLARTAILHTSYRLIEAGQSAG